MVAINYGVAKSVDVQPNKGVEQNVASPRLRLVQNSNETPDFIEQNIAIVRPDRPKINGRVKLRAVSNARLGLEISTPKDAASANAVQKISIPVVRARKPIANKINPISEQTMAMGARATNTLPISSIELFGFLLKVMCLFFLVLSVFVITLVVAGNAFPNATSAASVVLNAGGMTGVVG